MEMSDCTAARVHLVNPLWDPTGGGDLRTIDTWRLLRRHADVRIWTEFDAVACICRGADRAHSRNDA